MSVPFIFDMIPLQSLTYEEWRRAYCQKIRVRNWVSEFGTMPTGLHVVMTEEKIYLPWYRDEVGKETDFTAGEPIPAYPGTSSIIVRLPAVLVGRKFLVLDGCNRLTRLRPAVVILDYLEPSKEQRRAFMDLQNPFWSEE